MDRTELPEDEIASIERACTRLLNSLVQHVDHGRFLDVVALFTEDGEFHRPGMSAVGGAEIRAFMEGRPADVIMRHFLSPSRFESVSADEARSVTYMTLYQSEKVDQGYPALDGPVAVTELNDHFRRTAEGWRIASHVVIATMVRAH